MSVWQVNHAQNNQISTNFNGLFAIHRVSISAFVKQIKHIKMNELNDWQTEITIDALNHYWHYIVEKLSRNDLGDIERKNLELDKERTHSTLRYLGAF